MNSRMNMNGYIGKTMHIIKGFTGVMILCFALITPAFIQDVRSEASSLFNEEFILDPYDYDDYSADHAGAAQPGANLLLPASSATITDGADIVPLQDPEYPQSLLWQNQTGSVSWTFDLAEDGMYELELTYLPTQDRSGNIEFEVSVNDEIPFEEARQIAFGRVWRDAGPISQDNRGNDLRPTQIDHSVWMTESFKDKDGIYSDPYLFAFESGSNTIKLTCIRETFAIAQIRIFNSDRIPKYSQYREETEPIVLYDTGFNEFIQAESAIYKSDPSLYPVSDRISPITQPYHASKIRLNTIGGLNWRYPGQWIEWEFNVRETGDYVIALRSRQDQLRGLYSHRRIYIDGKVPFEELNEVLYKYDADWETKALGDAETPYLFRLDKGKHVIRIEAIVGSMGDTIRAVESAIYDLNYLYRKIIMITGVNPDLYRDYELEKEIPQLKGEFLRIAKLLEDELSRIESSIGKRSTESSLLQELAIQLKSLADNPRTIPERLDRYKTNVSSLSAWMVESKEQPLELDYLWVASPGQQLPRSKETIWEKLVHNIKTFLYSFIENYDLIGNVSEGKANITVWVGTGRDQAQIVKSMVEDLFVPSADIGVNVSLVQGTLMEATMAGKGPDAALNVARYLPVDLAVRGALLPLDGTPAFEEARKSFQDSSFIPYTFKGRVYAMPETQEFNMMFYRKDIFNELQIHPPETWEELYDLIPVIARRNMDIGIPSIIVQNAGDSYTPLPRTFPTFLIQRGLGLYEEGLVSTSFDSVEAIEAYKEFVDLYRELSLPVYYDFANRFRTGEMPIGIASYSTYNYLYIFAPEIRNLWEMVPIPGIKQSDGSINRSEEGYGSACVAFKNASDQEGARDFIYWWTGEEAQTRFAREMESLMGPAARQTVANHDAFRNLPWSAREIEMLMLQWDQVIEQPEIPGSYFVSRNLNNALIETIFDGGNALATLEKYNKYINEEITRKRIEFGLDK